MKEKDIEKMIEKAMMDELVEETERLGTLTWEEQERRMKKSPPPSGLLSPKGKRE